MPNPKPTAKLIFIENNAKKLRYEFKQLRMKNPARTGGPSANKNKLSILPFKQKYVIISIFNRQQSVLFYKFKRIWGFPQVSHDQAMLSTSIDQKDGR
jgi:hypothetical protein